ncbi:helix-turn-helix domain-containing protein [Streptomyces sp. RMIT01]
MSGDAEGAARTVLAERLSALRERSGRTYASLARRIGVSGSTLHRYCTGRTVPVEFAPVERLARLCGAPAEEREALHRLWLLADDERLDRQGATEGQEHVGARESGAPPKGAAASPPAPGALSGAAGRPGEEASEAVGSPASTPTSGTDSGSGSGSGTGSGSGSGSGSGQSGTIDGRTSRTSARRPRRIHRYGQGLGVLAAAVLVLALVAAFGRPWSSGPDGPSPAAHTPGGPAVHTPESPSPGSPRPGKPRGTAGGSAGSTPSGSPTRAESPGAGPRSGSVPESSASPSGPEAGRVPFTWTGDDHVWKNGCDHAYLLDRAPDAVPPPPAEADAASWAGALGAVHAGETGVRITLQGRDERAVLLESLRVRVVERRSPDPGRVYRMSSGCGGSLTPRMFDVDLDAPRPVARPLAGNDSGERIEAVAFPYRVSVTDPEVFLITGRTVGCDCSWVAELTWSSGGRSGTVRIDDGGRPFRTNGVRGRSVLDYDTSAGRWVPVADAAESGEPAGAAS